MSRALYLDTARLGLMSLSAQQLQTNFARLAGDPHGLLYFSDFLWHGIQACPADWRARFPGLTLWRGVQGLSESVRQLTGASRTSEVMFASRSATLMQLAAKQVVDFCQRVLTVDLLWPPYRRILAEACRRAGTSIAVCPLRAMALSSNATLDEIAAGLCRAYQVQGCDGLVLPLIDHRGITVPIVEIVTRLGATGCLPKQVIVDASQAIGHVPIDVAMLGCDWLIGGAHKWVGGYHPLGIGIARSPNSASLRSLATSDPLLRLTQEASGRIAARHGETAAILPLLTAAGAITDCKRRMVERRLSAYVANRQRLATHLIDAGWQPLRQHTEHHGILLAKPNAGTTKNAAASVRLVLTGRGISITSYTNGLARFSLPAEPFTAEDLHRLQIALTMDRSQLATGPIFKLRNCQEAASSGPLESP